MFVARVPFKFTFIATKSIELLFVYHSRQNNLKKNLSFVIKSSSTLRFTNFSTSIHIENKCSKKKKVIEGNSTHESERK